MSSSKSHLIKMLPEQFRHQLIRKAIVIRPIDDESKIRFQIAETQEDLEAAFALLHDCYVRIGIMDPHPSGMRCTVYTTLPYTTTIVAKQAGRVIGTVSLIRDSQIGFPSDKEYRKENDLYRSKGHKMVEVSALAVSPEFRSDHRISFHLMKYLYDYASKYMGCDMLCATVHPRAYDFYAGLLGFRRNGEEVNYGFVKGALAIHISLDIIAARREIMPRLFEGAPPEKDLFRFMADQKVPFDLPNRQQHCVLDPVMTLDMLRYFFIERTDVFESLSERELELVRSAYYLNFDLATIPELAGKNVSRRDFRYPMELDAVLLTNNRMAAGKVLNLSKKGLAFETNEKLNLDQVYKAIFNIGDEHFRISSYVRWEKAKPDDPKTTYGLEFATCEIKLLKSLKAIHHSEAYSPSISSIKAA